MHPLPLRLQPLLRGVALATATLAILHSPARAADVRIERIWQFAHQPGTPG